MSELDRFIQKMLTPVDILVIDDDGDIHNLLRHHAKDYLCNLIPANTEEEAKKLLEERKFKHIFLDLNLKGHTSVELYKWIRRYYFKLPVWIFSGSVTMDVAEDLRHTGFNLLVFKPDFLSQTFIDDWFELIRIPKKQDLDTK